MAVIATKAGKLEYEKAEGISVPHCFTTRLGGVSRDHLASLNLAMHRGDNKVFIDGKFVLFKFASKNATLSCMHPNRIKRGMKHRMEVVVTDYCGNVAKEEYQF